MTLSGTTDFLAIDIFNFQILRNPWLEVEIRNCTVARYSDQFLIQIRWQTWKTYLSTGIDMQLFHKSATNFGHHVTRPKTYRLAWGWIHNWRSFSILYNQIMIRFICSCTKDQVNFVFTDIKDPKISTGSIGSIKK